MRPKCETSTITVDKTGQATSRGHFVGNATGKIFFSRSGVPGRRCTVVMLVVFFSFKGETYLPRVVRGPRSKIGKFLIVSEEAIPHGHFFRGLARPDRL